MTEFKKEQTNTSETKSGKLLVQLEFKNPITEQFELRPSAKEDIVWIDKGTGKIIVPDYDHYVYRRMTQYKLDGRVLEDGDFIVQSDPDRKFKVKIYKRYDSVSKEECLASVLVNKETGKIHLKGPFAENEEIYTYRKQYKLTDGDFEFEV